MGLEEQIAKIIRDEYSEWEDEGRSDAAAHAIMALLVERGVISKI